MLNILVSLACSKSRRGRNIGSNHLRHDGKFRRDEINKFRLRTYGTWVALLFINATDISCRWHSVVLLFSDGVSQHLYRCFTGTVRFFKRDLYLS